MTWRFEPNYRELLWRDDALGLAVIPTNLQSSTLEEASLSLSSVDSWPSMNLHTENICKTSQPITTPSRSFMTVDLLRRTPGLPYMLVSWCALICNGSDTEGGHRVITKRRQKCSQRPDASRTLRLSLPSLWKFCSGAHILLFLNYIEIAGKRRRMLLDAWNAFNLTLGLGCSSDWSCACPRFLMTQSPQVSYCKVFFKLCFATLTWGFKELSPPSSAQEAKPSRSEVLRTL